MANENALPFELFLQHSSEVSRSLRYWAAPPLLYRLTIDPRRREEDVFRCDVDVCWVPRPGGTARQQLQLVCDWSGAEGLGIADAGVCVGIPVREITEKAAIGMMALLLPRMEGFAVESVLEVGTGADYEVMGRCPDDGCRIEVSGVQEARYPSDSSIRLTQKTEQLLGMNPRGFVSVTTFSYPPDGRLHSYLFFVFRQTDTMTENREATVGTSPNPEREASALALEAEVALYRADNVVAREKHLQAGKILKRCGDAAMRRCGSAK
jgi:hypothetical protein